MIIEESRGAPAHPQSQLQPQPSHPPSNGHHHAVNDTLHPSRSTQCSASERPAREGHESPKTALVMCRLRLGPKALALARLSRAQAFEFRQPSRQGRLRPGSGRLWLKPRLVMPGTDGVKRPPRSSFFQPLPLRPVPFGRRVGIGSGWG
jgi:hypothetical protein